MHNNLILYLPFNEKDGSTKAYDYSPSLKHANLENVTFTKGFILNGAVVDDGVMENSLSGLTVLDNFTILYYFKPYTGLGDLIVKVLNNDNVLHIVQGPLNVDDWNRISIIKSSTKLELYLNEDLIDSVDWNGELWNIAIETENDIEPIGIIDNLKVYNSNLSLSEIKKEFSSSNKLQYFIEGKEFIEHFGVYVSASKGVIDGLARKETISHSWKEYHGRVIDLATPKFESRIIELECFIVANGKIDMVDKFQKFLQEFEKPKTSRLKINIDETKPLVYEVVKLEATSLNKKWRDEKFIGTFNIKLEEIDPIKKVYRHIRTSVENKTASFTITSPSSLTIHWGDGTKTPNVRGTAQTITHDYTENGSYEIIIAGNIEDIISITTNEIMLWEKL